VTFLPIPYGTVTQGVVWLPDDARVSAETAGEATRFLAAPGTHVAAGDALLELHDPYIAAKHAAAEARLQELEARLAAVEPHSAYEAQLTRNQITFAQDDLAETARREQALVLKSPADGTFLVPRQDTIVGSFVKQGDTIGYVMSATEPVVRAVVPESEIDLVRSRAKGVAVRLDGAIMRPVDGATVTRQFPAATRKLPSHALSSNNGGPLTLDPSDKDENTALQPFFTVDIAVPSDLVRDHWGERVWIRFDHGATPMLERWWRQARQVFLGRFHV
jgi:putative peptide zinc metalloprotease protein